MLFGDSAADSDLNSFVAQIEEENNEFMAYEVSAALCADYDVHVPDRRSRASRRTTAIRRSPLSSSPRIESCTRLGWILRC